MEFLKIVLALCLCVACSAKAIDKHEDHHHVVDMVNKFGFDLLKDMAKETKEPNVIVSPLSAYIVMGMAASGAAGHTYEQMQDVLHFPNVSEAQQSLHKLMEESNDKGVMHSMADGIFFTDDIVLKPEFEKVIKDSFHSSMSKLNPKDRAGSVKSINDWSNKSTHGRIPMIMNEDDIKDPNTFMVLLNAVYFKGDWKKVFDAEATSTEEFHGLTKKTAEMMYLEHEFYWGEFKNLKAKFIELPYEHEDYKMTVIVPTEGNVDELLKNFNPSVLADMKEERHVSKLSLSMPKFKMDVSKSMNEPLMHMGMTDMFDDNSADFSNMMMSSSKKMKVKEVKQRVFMEVNERGSEAAAETSVSFVLTKAIEEPAPAFKVDRPSIFLITKKDAVLFMGYFKDPVY